MRLMGTIINIKTPGVVLPGVFKGREVRPASYTQRIPFPILTRIDRNLN